ncbi:gliding motility-associated C-terminal domain-containing protein [Neolewinella sp.]|uniref:T9SS type B sorting domain-containing protein n=1 Tax=Neolewinella sp. TaxID=2993543 RepID=UPI003B5196EA
MLLPLRCLVLLLFLSPSCLQAQQPQCTGPSYAQFHVDAARRDVRLTCVVDYPQASGRSSTLVGGMIDGDIYLSRHAPDGDRLWEIALPTGSESTELTTLNTLLLDPDGMIAGVGSLFRSGNQYAFLFRYDPVAGRLLYLREADFPSDPNTLLLDQAGNYLITGARLNLPAPDFLRAYQQRLDRATGSPIGEANLMDLDGDERIFDAVPHPGGGFVVTGQAVRGGGAGSIRTLVARMNDSGELSQAVMGFAAAQRNARIFGYDVEVVNETVYVLQWGDLDTLTGSFRTAPALSAFDLNNNVLWTRRLNLDDYDGEVGIELEPHAGGLLIYGYALGKERDIFLIHTDLNGGVRWANSYIFPGRVLLYARANQQLLPRPTGIALTATYVFNGGRSHEGLLLQLTPSGAALSDCVTVRPLTVTVSNPPATWSPTTLVSTPFAATFSTLASAPTPSLRIDLTDDCDIPCDDCDRQSFVSLPFCAGDSALVNGRWRSEPGIYRDTFPSTTESCDSIVTTELLLQGGPTATYRQIQSCGLPTAEVRIEVTGGVAPYRYRWSDTTITGDRPNLAAGTYTVTITDSPACAPVTLPITVSITEESFSLITRPPTCPSGNDGSIVLSPTGSGSLRLLQNATYSPDSLSGLTAGDYSFIVRTTSGCEVFRQLQVPESAASLHLRLTGPTTVTAGTPVTYTTEVAASSPTISYRWSPPERLDCPDCSSATARFLTDTTLTVTALDESGCTASDSLRITVLPGEPSIYIPNAFSPNGDGQNDRWVPGFGPQVAHILRWQVFDRWGTEIWAYDPQTKTTWTGGAAGAGVYVYSISLQLVTGQIVQRSGSVTLIR